jgi:hypothetical protein
MSQSKSALYLGFAGLATMLLASGEIGGIILLTEVNSV